MKFVLDEWLWADLRGDNGADRQQEAFRFLEAVFECCDRIVMPRGTPFARKFWDLAEVAAPGDRRRGIVKYFRLYFEQNAEKAEKLHLSAGEREQSGLDAAVKPGDHYLVIAYRQSDADRLVTTDGPLIEALKKLDVAVVHRDRFLPDYLRRQ